MLVGGVKTRGRWVDESLQVLHVDNHLLAVSKRAGEPCVPDSSGDLSLFDRARTWIERTYHKPGRAFLGVVHRLDRPVSGVVVFGRTSKGAARLSAAFAEKRVSKLYWAVAGPAGPTKAGELRQYLWKDVKRNRVTVVRADRPGAKLAETRWVEVERAAGRSLYALLPATGRSHQLRVAMASLERPLLGDLRYGPGPALEDRSVALHARALILPHPTQDHGLLLSAAPPQLSTWSFQATKSAASFGRECNAEQAAVPLERLILDLDAGR